MSLDKYPKGDSLPPRGDADAGKETANAGMDSLAAEGREIAYNPDAGDKHLKPKHEKGLPNGERFIEAPPEVVFAAIQHVRDTDKNNTKISKGVIEQKVDVEGKQTPVILNIKDIPYSKIEFELKASEIFDRFQGAYELTATADGTKVRLTTDTHLKHEHLPWKAKAFPELAKNIMHKIATERINERLDKIERVAKDKLSESQRISKR
jgi:hypothetical protein